MTPPEAQDPNTIHWPDGDVVGLARGTVALVDTDPEWERLYHAVATDISAALGDAVDQVEHVGSTAVPGLPAKPIVDIAVVLTEGTNIGDVVSALENAGFIHCGDKGDEGGVLFVFENRPEHRLAHIHVHAPGDHQWDQYLRFRDRLLAEPSLRAAYAQLKKRLAGELSMNRGAYTAAKAKFITEVLDRTE